MPLRTRKAELILFGLSPGETSFRGVWLLAALAFVPLAIAAMLAPLVYLLADLWHARTGSEFAFAVQEKGPVRAFHIIRWTATILALPLVLRAVRPVRQFGLRLDLAAMRGLVLAYFAGLALLACLAALQIAFGPVVPRPEFPTGAKLLRMFGSSGLIGLLEETVFRGLVLMLIYTATRRLWLALVLTSAIFALVHFQTPKDLFTSIGHDIDWLTGWEVAWSTLSGIATHFHLTGFVSLFLLGIVLGALRLRSAGLWPAIGLHAGIVMGYFVYKRSYYLSQAEFSPLWGTTSLTDGWVTAAILALVAVCLILWPCKTGH